MSFVKRAFKAVVNAVVGVVKAVVKAVVDVVSSVVNFALQAFMPNMPGMDAAGEAQRQQGVLIQREGSNIDVPVIYGHRKVGGNVVYVETGSTDNKYLWVAYVLSEGCVEGLREIYIDDNLLPVAVIADLNSGKTVTVAEGKYKNRVQMRFSPGVYFATPNATLNTDLRAGVFAGAPGFSTDMYFNGLATLFVRYEWLKITTQAESDANPFGGGIPKLQACVLGRRVASLVNNLSQYATYEGNGQNGPDGPNPPYGERYSTNPAEILLDYLRNPRYGKGLSNSEINWDSFRTAAAKLNTGVTYYSGSHTGAIITCNTVLGTDQSLLNNIRILLQGMRGYMPYVQGQYKLRIEDAGDPTDILSGSALISMIATTAPGIDSSDTGSIYADIQGDITYTGIERSAKYTQVVVTYVDPDQGWSNQQVVFPETEAERLTLVTADGGRENSSEVTMGTITNRYMALDFARLILNKSRYQETCTVTVSSRGFEIEPGDCIRIAGTILNFGDIPWRVISMSYNDDYTIQLGCVRNPDFIYPYVRAGEADTIVGLFRPVGASINPPVLTASGGGIGVLAPTTSISSNTAGYTSPGNVTVITTNPGPTDITITTGNTAVSNTTANTSTINNDPVTPPQPPPLNDTIDITKITYTDSGAGIFATIEFKQPAHSLYQGVDWYWKRTTESAWQTAEILDKPGANQTITYKFGPLIIPAGFAASQAVNNFRARVKYSTGEYSTLFATGQFTPSATSGTTADIKETIQITSSAWTTPVLVTETTARNNSITVTGLVASLGSPGSARTISFNCKDDVINESANWNIDGIVVYYKASASTYWDKIKHDISTTFVPGQVNTFAFTGDIGIAGGAVNYDFIFRWYYTDGTESTVQQRYMAIRVESPFGQYTYDPFYGQNGTREASSAYAFVTTDNAPPEAKGAAANVSVGINFIGGTYTNGQNYLNMAIDPPNASDMVYYRGLSLNYRKVIPGGNPPLTTANIVPQISSQTGRFQLQPAIAPIEFDQQYELIVTPITSANRALSNYSQRGVGYVHNRQSAADYPANTDWSPTWNFETLDTNTALRKAAQAFSSVNPTVSVQDVVGITGSGAGSYTPGFIDLTTSVRLNQYMRIRFYKPAIGDYVQTWIYRRRSGSFVNTIGGGQFGSALYTGLGRWEKIPITDATHAPDGTGLITVNLRGPTDGSEFNPYYQVPGYSGTQFTSLTDPNLTTRAGQGWKPGRIPYYPLSSGDAYKYTEWLLIVETTSGLSSKAVRFVPVPMQINYAPAQSNLVPANIPTIVDWAKYNTDYTAGYNRRLDEARTLLAVGDLQYLSSGSKWTTTGGDTKPVVYITTSPTLR